MQNDDDDDAEPLCFSIRQFCKKHGISVATYYRLSRKPPTISVGRRRLISREAAARWRSQGEDPPT